MHGVLKVKSSAQQEAEKRKERQEKAEKFKKLTRKIFDKRKCKELDDELMSLTEKLLSSNPDFNTIWNIRKEIFLKLKDERSEEELNDLYSNELRFLQSCLHVNPKSYGVWEHRRFSLQNMPSPDWKNDLKLCNQFLMYDSRNFHCWNYRRFVVKNAEVSSQDEFDFTMKKISENFSNYSAWHYRSKLLPLVHPDPENKSKIGETALLKEFELVQNAFFTDPNDQSAWFYQRWLLGREERKAEVLYLSARKLPDGLKLILSLSKQINLQREDHLQVYVNDVEINGLVWKSSDESELPSYVWTTKVDQSIEAQDCSVKAILAGCDAIECTLVAGADESSWHWSQAESNLIFRDNHTAAKTTVLENELDSCKMLLEEETENKWVMLTVIFLMRALDPVKYKDETYALLSRVMECDSMRKEYYRDLRSRYKLEDELRRKKREKENFEILDLGNMELSAVYHWQYLIASKTLKLAGNQLKMLPSVHLLQNAISLNLDDNQLCNLDGFSKLPYLEELSIRRNCIKTLDELKKLQSSTTIKHISISGNPVCNVIGTIEETVKDIIPSLQTLGI